MTWPNVLATRYMMATDTLTPEIELTARQYLNQGYQRVLTFECDGGGFNWWEGDTPGNAVLSSLVIQFLSDSAEVSEVDPEVVARTQRWLVAVQRDDGSWSEERHLHAGNETMGASSLRATAYVLWGLAHSGYQGPGLDEAVQFLLAAASSADDVYTTALVANALLAAGRQADARPLLDRIFAARQEDAEGIVHWPADTSTMVGSYGAGADIESTALAALALLAGGVHLEAAGGAVEWVVTQKDDMGNWYSTQATVLALKLLLASVTLGGASGAGVVDVYIDDALVDTLDITEDQSDVVHTLDLQPYVHTGTTTLRLAFSGEGRFLYQAVASYHVPWPDLDEPDTSTITIDIGYDATEMAVDDIVGVTVTVRNLSPADTAMILVDLGLPPGFDLVPALLDEAVAAGAIATYETTPRQLLVYLDTIPALDAATIRYELRARHPLRASTPASRAYPYYEPENDATAEPTELTVE